MKTFFGLNKSYESSARSIIQRLRPNAKKNGLQRAIVEARLRESLPGKYRNANWKEMKKTRDYKWARETAEYYRPPFTPDLSEVYPEDREIILYEIEDSSRISSEKLEKIRFWQGVTMDGWDWWDVVLITTNGFGLGWDALIDTVATGRTCALASLRDGKDQWIKSRPHLDTESAILNGYQWRNWRMPEMHEFESIRSSMSLL